MVCLPALCWYPEGVAPAEPVVLRSWGLVQKRVENAGQAFWDRFELPLFQGSSKGKKRRDDGSTQDSPGLVEESERDRAFRERKEKREREQKSKDGGLLKISEDIKGRDLYELLEVNPSDSAEDIKKSYRKLVLAHHPDKLQDPTEEQKRHFLLIQEAFEILSDVVKRRRYESTLPFDDSIPTSLRKGEDFFETFEPVFKRNARWSVRPRVPGLGDQSTPIDAVKKFYEFWYDFESWRDPLALAELDEEDLHCLDQAECREERRWMERENAKVMKKIKQAERDRLLDLVKLAEKHDPRMLAHREKLRNEKEEEKARKAAIKEAERLKAEEEERAAEAVKEAARRAEEERRKAERKEKEEQRTIVKNARQAVKDLHRNAEPTVRRAVHAEQLREVCLRLSVEELQLLASQLEAGLAKPAGDAAVKLLHDEMRKIGVTPIEDNTVRLDGKSEETETKQEKKRAPEEVEAERVRAEAAEKASRERRQASEKADRERREQKAEEQRKKREQQRKEEEKRQAAQRKAESKAQKAQDKAAAKEVQRVEEQRQLAVQRAEEQRLAAIAEAEERKRQEDEAVRLEAYEQDCNARLAVLEGEGAEDLTGTIQNMLTADMRQELQEIGTRLPEAEAVRLPKAPDPKAQGKKAAAEAKAYAAAKAAAEAAKQQRRDAEESLVDLGVDCLVQVPTADFPEGAAQLVGAFALAVRPQAEALEPSKEIKARIKKQRLRIRTAVLRILRQLQTDEAA